MMNSLIRGVVCGSAIWLTCLSTFIAAEAAAPIPIWPGAVPGEKGDIGPEKHDRSGTPSTLRITNVTQPTITLFRADQPNGCGVIVCPGGGYNILAYDKEGTEIAEWLNSIGVTAVVLKYRVPRRDPEKPHWAPLQDVQRAIRLTRQNAKDWGIDPDRLGVLGFSAGGHLTVMAGTHWEEQTYRPQDEADRLSCRPDFLIPIYPAYLGDQDDPDRLSPLVRITKETPPVFVAIAYDDKDRAIYSALLLVALKRAGVPAELHVYSTGGHGYGMRPAPFPAVTWPKRCEEWMRVSGWID